MQREAGSPRQDGPQSEVDTVLDLQQAYGNQAVVQLLAAGRHGSPPPVVRAGSSIGNRAWADLLGRPGVQREAPKGGAAGGPGAQDAKTRAAKPKGKSSAVAVDSLIDLLNDFQDLAAAAVNRQGAGLESIRLGKRLHADHRYLLNHLRAIMIQARSEDPDERKLAAKSWPWISKKLQAAVGEATNLNFRGDVIAAVNDAIAQVGLRYFRAQRQATDPEPETFESYRDVVKGINELTFAFERMGEAGDGIIREEVPKRKDIAVSQAVIEINKKQRDRLAAVKLGDHLTRQHRQTLETLRAILTTARTETAGSAYRAWARWQKLQRTLDRMLQRTTVFAEVDLGAVRQSLANAGETLANHYRVVHAENIRAALKRERSDEEKQSDKEKEKTFGPGMSEVLREKRAIQDFRHALSVIERDLGPSPTRPDEWVLMRDGQPIRLRAEQGMAVREAARTQVKEYMASLVTAMVEAWLTYDSIKRGTGSTRRKVLGFIGGADDPGDQSDARNAIIEFRDTVVYKLADEGKYVAALEAILSRKGDVERRARAVGDYDTDLDRGYKRLAIGASVVQVALVSLVPMAGAAAMAPTIVGGVVVAEGASALAVGTTAVAAGATAPALVETGRQLASDEKMDYGKIANTAKTGGLIGFSAVAPVVTNKVAGFIAPGATGTTAVGANMAASSLMGGLQSKAGGGSFLEGAAGGGLGSLAGSVVNQAAPVANAPLTNMAMQGVAGGAVSYATGQDVLSGVVGGMAGSAGDRMLLNRAGGGGGAPTTTPGGAGGPAPGDTLPGFGFDGRGPAAPGGSGGRGGPGDTMIGTGIDPRLPATRAGDTMSGTGIDPRLPATRAGDTMIGTGIDPRLPATRTGDTKLGMGPDGAAPVGGGSAPKGPPTGVETEAPPDPAKLLGGKAGKSTRSEFAALDDYKGRKPIVGDVVHIIDNAEDAAALYRRLSAEDRRPARGTEDAAIEAEAWSDDGGKGTPPMAWVRAKDGAVRFNFSRFPRPNLGGYTDAPLGPIRSPAGAGQRDQPGPSAPLGQPGAVGQSGPGPRPQPAIFPGSNHPLQPGMRPARVATDAEVKFQLEHNPKKVFQTETDDQFEQYYRMDHGAGDVPDAFWSGGTIIVGPGYRLPPSKGGRGGAGPGRGQLPQSEDPGLVGDKDDPTMKAPTMDKAEYEATPRKLTPQDEKDIASAVARVRRALEQKLTALRDGRGGGESHKAFKRLIGALKAANLPQNQAVIDHAQVVWDALHDPSLIAEVLSNAYGESLRSVSTGGASGINRALLREAAKGGPIHVVPLGTDIDKVDFFKFWVQTGRRFYDQVDAAAHGNMTHLIQDLVVDVALRRHGMEMTSAQFRQALGRVEAPSETDPGRKLWEAMYDATDNGINQPEYLMPTIREVAEVRDIR